MNRRQRRADDKRDRIAAPASSSAPALFTEALRQQQAGHPDRAATLYGQGLALQPNVPQAHYNLGIALKALGQLDAAEASYRRATELQPDFADAHYNRGLVLQELGQRQAAVACYHRAVALRPGFVGAHNNLGLALAGLGQLDAAAASYRHAIALQPDFAEAHLNLGAARKQQGRLEEAGECCRRALALRPDYAEAHVNLGTVLKEQGSLDAAGASYRRAIDLNPACVEAHYSLGTALAEQRRLRDAVGRYRDAIALRPDFAAARFALGMALLALGEWPEGWAEYEWRWLGAPHLAAARRDFAQPQWRGEAGAGRTLLVHAEQGLGDTLQFCRFAPLAAERGWRVVLEVQPPLVRLLRSLPGVAHVLARGEAVPAFDLHCPTLSLPGALAVTPAMVSGSQPYLHSDAAAASAWVPRLEQRQGLRVGLVWAGSARAHSPELAAVDRRRSLALDRLAPLLALPGLQWFSLQKDGPPPPADAGLVDFMPAMADFADTAALMANLDLVISVDTAAAHLAAALGRPVWLLDRFDSCWRWLDGRRDSPWYPSLRLYRQRQPGKWDSVIDEIADDLQRLAAT